MKATKSQLIEKQRLYDEWKRKRDSKEEVRPDPVVAESPQRIESDEQKRQREENRRKYPELAAWVDEVRKHFPDAKVVSLKTYTPEQTAERKRCMELGLPMPDFD